MTINNIFSIYIVLSFFIMGVLIILTIYNYLSCISLRYIYETIMKEKHYNNIRKTNKKQDNLILETKNAPSYNVVWSKSKYKKVNKTMSK